VKFVNFISLQFVSVLYILYDGLYVNLENIVRVSADVINNRLEYMS